ncbi:MAG: hypothetical protein ACM3X4_03190 [Ignavibacteriales bacterium]
MRILDLVKAGGCQSVAIVGTAKNVGKTVTLNCIIRQAEEDGLAPGITSTGRDGERIDVVTSEEKPVVYVPEGSLVATAEATLRESEVYAEILEVMPYTTLMGDVVLGRVKEPGNVEIVGPETADQLRKTLDAMKRHGARLVLVDGAIDRIASAAPTITDATIIATGAAAARTMQEVLDRTALLVEFFGLQGPADRVLGAAARKAAREKLACLIDEGYAVRPLHLKTALEAGGAIASAISDSTRAVVFGGAVVDAVIEPVMDLPRRVKDVEVLVHDATRMFLSRIVWDRFRRLGGKISVVYPIKVLALTINPLAPGGVSYNPDEFLKRMARVAAGIPVFDLVLGKSEVGA